MSAVKETWEVKPHGPVEEVDDGILTVLQDIRMPLCTFPRRMTVARLADGGTAIFSAIALDEPGMARIEAMGKPAALIVPNAVHRLDARIWKQRYPSIRVLAPPGARKRAEEAVPVDATGDALGDPEVRFVVVPGTGGSEAALEVRRAGGLTLVINDLVGNVREPHDFMTGIIVRLMGFGGSPPRLPAWRASCWSRTRLRWRRRWRPGRAIRVSGASWFRMAIRSRKTPLRCCAASVRRWGEAGRQRHGAGRPPVRVCFPLRRHAAMAQLQLMRSPGSAMKRPGTRSSAG